MPFEIVVVIIKLYREFGREAALALNVSQWFFMYHNKYVKEVTSFTIIISTTKRRNMFFSAS